MAQLPRNHWHGITGMGGTMTSGLSKRNKTIKLPYFNTISRAENTPYFFVSNQKKDKKEQLYIKDITEINGDSSGIIDSNMKIMVPFEYDKLKVLNKHLIAAWKYDDEKFHLFNGKGNQILELNGRPTVKQENITVHIDAENDFIVMDTVGNILIRTEKRVSLLYPDLNNPHTESLPNLYLYPDSTLYYGLFNLENKQLLPSEYFPITQKMEGLYALKKKDSIYFVNNHGNLLYNERGFSGGEYHILRSYNMLYKNENGYWGMIDAHGKEKIPFEYDTAGIIIGWGHFIGKNETYSLLDDLGNIRFPLQSWLPFRYFEDNYYQDPSLQLYELKDGEMQALKAVPESLLKNFLKFDTYHSIREMPKNNTLGHPSGYYNRQLKRIAPLRKFAPINNRLPKDQVLVSDSLEKNIAIVDSNGQFLINYFPTPKRYKWISNSFLAYYNSDSAVLYWEENGKYKSAEIISPYSPRTSEFSIELNNYDPIFTFDENKKGLILNNGQVLYDSSVTEIINDPSFYRVKKGQKWGLMDYNGEYIHLPDATSIIKNKGYYLINANNKKGLYDISNKVYIRPVYEEILLGYPGSSFATSLINGFLGVKKNDGWALVDKYERVHISGLDSINLHFSLNAMTVFKDGSEIAITISKDGNLELDKPKSSMKKDYR